jgi:hypothetical protein
MRARAEMPVYLKVSLAFSPSILVKRRRAAHNFHERQ